MQEYKQVTLSRGPSQEGRVNEESKESECDWCAFYTCENGIFKPIKITIKRGLR
jgi:hypothetical protein